MPRIWNPDPNQVIDEEPTLDAKAMQAYRAQLIAGAAPHHPLYKGRVSDEELQRMRGSLLRNDDGVVNAVVSGLQIVGTAETQKAAALIATRHEQNQGVGSLMGTYDLLSQAYGTAWVARAYANWNRTQQWMSYLRGLYDEAMKSANPDPKHVAAWTEVKAALDEQERQQSQSQKAKESARKEGAGDLQTLLQEVKELRQALAQKDQVVAGLQRRLTEFEQGVSPVPTPPSPVRSRPR